MMFLGSKGYLYIGCYVFGIFSVVGDIFFGFFWFDVMFRIMISCLFVIVVFGYVCWVYVDG